MLFYGWIVILIMVIVKTSAICTDCWQNTSLNRCVYESCHQTSNCQNELDLNIFTTFSKDFELLCRSPVSLTFLWRNISDMHYFLQYSLQNDSNSITFSNATTKCNHLTITNLIPNQVYDVHLYAYSLVESKLYKYRKISVETAKRKARLDPVKSLNYTLSLVKGAFEVSIFWNPGSDLTCYYNILYHDINEMGDYNLVKYNLKIHPENRLKLPTVEFGTQYNFKIRSTSQDGKIESKAKQIQIEVPKCIHPATNLSMCIPIQPKNFTLRINTTTNTKLQLNWNKPLLFPDYYILKATTFDKYNIIDSLIANVSGEKNSWIFRDVLPFTNCTAQITAMTKAGSSKPRILHYPPFPLSSNITNKISQIAVESQNLWIWMVFLVLIVTFLGLITVFRQKITNFCGEKKQTANDSVKFTAADSEDAKWELMESKLFIDKVIGFGAFGIVQKGCYYLEPDKKIVVAIKTLKAKPNNEQIAQFYDEIEIMKSVPYHAHIVHLIGVVTKNRLSNPLMLVEYCAGGDLQSYLRKIASIIEDSSQSNDKEYCDNETSQFFNKSYDMFSSTTNNDEQIMRPNDLLSFARQIVLGMEYLSNLKVIHRDLAARNVLITENNTLKISDFGLSRDIYTDSIYRKVTGGKLPFRWMALESLTHQIYTTESDVWSFGIVLWEIVTLGCNPYPSVNTEDLVTLLKSGYRMKKPINCSEDLYQIMLHCWHATPNLRPSFKDLRVTFDRLLECKMQYICLDNTIQLQNSNSYENMDNQI